jgi:hypothetical protein
MNFFKNLEKTIKLFFYKYSTFILSIFSYLIYFLSLEKCLDGEELCGNNMKWIYTKVFEIILSCEIVAFLIIKILFYKSSKLHFLHLILIFYLLYLYSHGFYFFNHGKYNMILFLVLLFLNLIIILLFKAIIYVFRIKNKIDRVLKLFIIFFFFSFIIINSLILIVMNG